MSVLQGVQSAAGNRKRLLGRIFCQVSVVQSAASNADRHPEMAVVKLAETRQVSPARSSNEFSI